MASGAYSTLEQEVFDRIRRRRIRLRFDRVVRRLVGEVQAALADAVPTGEAVLFTVTAPIRLPARTSTALRDLLRDGLPPGEHRRIVHGNQVRVRRLVDLPQDGPNVLGFVHDAAADPDEILAVAEARLRQVAPLPG